MPIAKFEAIYLVDLCDPLLDIARKRFKDLGWKNVHVVKEDATILGWTLKQKITLATFSYSLSMIPNFYAALDRINELLDPEGILGVVDFYVSGREQGPLDQAVNPTARQVNWLPRIFWMHWLVFPIVLFFVEIVPDR